jgi:hypothetical protein
VSSPMSIETKIHGDTAPACGAAKPSISNHAIRHKPTPA